MRTFGKKALALSSFVTACVAAAVGALPTSCSRTELDLGAQELDAEAGTSCPSSTPTGEPSSPIDYGERDVTAALGTAGSSATVRVVTADDPAALPAEAFLDMAPESYAIVADGSGGTLVVGSDAVGAMYGAFELAERVGLDGAGVLPPTSPITGTPAMRYRSYNPYIVMPDPDGEPCWYFLDASYWQAYLDELAHARINFLDLHAMYNLSTTLSPNALMWFATSTTYPDAGPPANRPPGQGPPLPPADGQRIANARMLETIVEMAHARGIEVGLLSARSDLAVDAVSTADQQIPFSQADLEQYTREAVADLLQRVPQLDALGVRVGEGNSLPADAGFEGGVQAYFDAESAFYENTYLPAMRAAGTHARFYTRSWLTDRAALEPLLAQAGGADAATVLVKFSAEQLGPSWVPQDPNFVGGNVFFPSYLYENYLDGPGAYTFVFHVWNSAAFRFFRYASYARTARLLASMTALSPRVAGFTLQAAATYGRQRDFWHANADDVYSPWTFQRDELEAHLYGRLGYDPSTPESTLRTILAARVGTDGLWEPEQAGSDIVAWMVSMRTCGPDSRDFAPQLMTAGLVTSWANAPMSPADPVADQSCGTPPLVPAGGVTYHGPLDEFSFASPYETARDLVMGAPTTRISARDVAQIVLADAAQARQAAAVAVDPGNAWARDVQRECIALADLGDYFGHKLRGATALAVYQRAGGADYLSAATTETQAADEGWAALANDTSYVKVFQDPYFPFPPPVTGIDGAFHWAMETPLLGGDVPSIMATGTQGQPPAFPLPDAGSWLTAPYDAGPGLASIVVDPRVPTAPVWHVTITLAAAPPAGATVSVLWKPFATTTAWSAPVPAPGAGNVYQADVQNATPNGAPANGALFVAEVMPPSGPSVRGWMYPSPLTGAPYVSVAP